jgi:hypothetical protein
MYANIGLIMSKKSLLSGVLFVNFTKLFMVGFLWSPMSLPNKLECLSFFNMLFVSNVLTKLMTFTLTTVKIMAPSIVAFRVTTLNPMAFKHSS